jgi:hypothetical protein
MAGMSTLAELGITEDEWVRLHRLNQAPILDDVSPAVVLAEVRRIVSGEDAPYDEGPPFGRLAGLVGWLDQRDCATGETDDERAGWIYCANSISKILYNLGSLSAVPPEGELRELVDDTSDLMASVAERLAGIRRTRP